MAGDAHQTVSVTLQAETEGFRRQLRVSREDWDAWRQAADRADRAARETGQGLETLGHEAAEAARGADALAGQAADAARQVDALGDQAGQSSRQVDTLSGRVDHLGRSAGTVRAVLGGLVIAAAGLAAIRLGREAVESWVDYEAALTGVGKTADLAGTQLAALGEDIQALARRPEMGATTLELLEIAQAAGQLGVTGTANIEHFTSTIAKLQGASDVAGGEGATQLARLLEVTGDGPAAVDRLASSVVALGNNFAATESEIVAAALEVAKGGAAFDVTADQAAGLATALTAIGVRAELSRSVTQRAFQAIGDAIRDGGAEMRVLEAITGETAEALRAAWAEDAVAVFEDFLQGLAEVQRAGGDAAAVLEALGLTAGEDVSVLTSLAKAHDTLAAALDTAGRAWTGNIALTEEARRAGETAAAQFGAVGEVVWQASLVLGEALAPALLAAAEDITAMIMAARESGDLAEWAAWVARALTEMADAAVWAVDNAELLAPALAAVVALETAAWLGEVTEGVTALAHGLTVLRTAMLAHPLLAAAAAAVALGAAVYIAAEETREQQQAVEDLYAALEILTEKTGDQQTATDEDTAATRENARATLIAAQARLELVRAQMAWLDANDPHGLRADYAPGYQAGVDANRAALRQEMADLEAGIAAAQNRLIELNARDLAARDQGSGGGGGDSVGGAGRLPPPPDLPEPPASTGSGDAWAQWVAQTQLATAAALALAEAQDRGAAAIRAAEVAAAAEGVVLQYGAQHRAEIVALLTDQAAAQQALALAQTVADLDHQIAAEQALTAAHRLGRDAVAAANVERQTADILARHNIESGTKEAEVIREKVAALAEEAEERERAEVLGGLRDRLEALQDEAEYLAEVTAQRALSRAELETIQSLTERGIDLTSEHARQELALADAIDEQHRATELARAAATDWADGATQAIHDYQVAVEDSAAITEDAFTGVFESWEASLADFISEFDFSIDSAKALIEDLGDAVLSELARIAAQSIVGSMASGIGSLFGLSSSSAAPPAPTSYSMMPAPSGTSSAVPGGGTVVPAPAGGVGTTTNLITAASVGSSLFSSGPGWGTSLVTGSIGQALGLYSPITYSGVTPGAPIALFGPEAWAPLTVSGGMTTTGSIIAGGLNAAPWGIAGSIGAGLLGFQGSGDPLIDLGLQGGGAILGGIGGTALGGAIGGTMFGMSTGSVLGPVGAIGGAFLGTVLGDTLFGAPIPSVSADFRVGGGEFSGYGIQSTAWNDPAGYAASAEGVFGPSVSHTSSVLADYDLEPDLALSLAEKDGQTAVHWAYGDAYDYAYVEDMAEASLVAVETLLEVAAKDAQTLGSNDQARYIQRVLDTHEATSGDELAAYFQHAVAFADDFDAVLSTMMTGVVDYADSARSAAAENLQAAQTSMEDFLDMTGDLLPGRVDEATEAVQTAALVLFGLTEDADVLAPELQAFIGELQGVQDEFANVMGAAGWTEENISEAGFASLAEAENEAVRRALADWLETVDLTTDGIDALEEAFGDLPGILDLLAEEAEDTRESIETAWEQRERQTAGRGYLTTIDALEAEYDAALDLAAETGADTTAITGAITAEMAGAVAGLDRVSLYTLIQQFAASAIVVDGLELALHQMDAAARQAADALETQWAARLAAANDDDSLETALAAFDQAAQAEYIAAAANPHADLALLEETLAAERLRVIEEYHRREMDAEADVHREAIDGLRDLQRAAQALADYAASAGQRIRAAAVDMQLSAAVAGGTDRAALDAAEQLFLGALGTIASSEDEDAVRLALDNLADWGRAFEEASAAYWGTQGQHYDNLVFIQEALNGVADALGAADPAEGDAGMAALLASIRDNTSELGPLAKAEQLSDQLAVIFGGAGPASYLYKLMESSTKVEEYTKQIAEREHVVAYLSTSPPPSGGGDTNLDTRQWAAPGFEQHIAANYDLARTTGYEGDFGAGGFSAWIAQQVRQTQAAAAHVLLSHGQGYRLGWHGDAPNLHPDTVDPDYQAANTALRAATGYMGAFGDGLWNAWIAQQSADTKYLARQILYAYGQSERVSFAHGGWVSGPGGWTDDLVEARLSNQEFVLRAAAATYVAGAAPGLLEALNDNQVSITPLPAMPDIPPAPNVVPFAPVPSRDDDALIERVERLETAVRDLEAALHDEASAGRRTDGGLTQALVDELRALRRDLAAGAGRADLAARAAVGGRRR